MQLVVCLGNPGAAYRNHRHNVGFMVGDEIVAAHALGPDRARFQAITNEGTVGGHKILLIRPQTFMNESGRAVGEAMRFYKLDPSDVIVFYDEIDLAFGKVRIKLGGGAAGHNGIRSVAAHIGPHFVRVRIGIGHPGDKARVHGHVLGDFSAAERPEVAKLISSCARHLPGLLAGDEAGFMNRVALDTQPPRPPKTPKKPNPGETADTDISSED